MKKSLRRRLQNFAALPREDRALIVEAAFWLGAARVAVVVLPFRAIARWLGVPMASSSEPSPADALIARRIGGAVARAAHHVPWKAVCLPQAIAAKAMLRRRGIGATLHFGVSKQGERLGAHAWLMVGTLGVSGIDASGDAAEILRFS